jgi:small subunit ribosomal protein S4
MVKRATPPGQHGRARQGNPSQYAIQLREKQKVKRLYGLLEKPFRKLVEEAQRLQGSTGDQLLVMLEQRLDNVVYRAGFAVSRNGARQIVTHGHVELNGRRVDIPSIRVKAGDEIVVRAKSQKSFYFTNLNDLVPASDNDIPAWITSDRKKFKITVKSLPTREDAEPDITDQLIVEYYSR